MKAIFLALLTITAVGVKAQAKELPMITSTLIGHSPTQGAVKIEQAHNGYWYVSTKKPCTDLPCSVNEWTSRSAYTPGVALQNDPEVIRVQLGSTMLVSVSRPKVDAVDGLPVAPRWQLTTLTAEKPETIDLIAVTSIDSRPIIEVH